MAERLSQSERSELMSRIRGRDTTPERVVRSIIRGFGLRYRLHDKKLPGCPDVVIPSAVTVLLVHGCFWHRHSCARGKSRPAARPEFWDKKFANNVRRDRKTTRALRQLGYAVVIVWECQTKPKTIKRLKTRLSRAVCGRESVTTTVSRKKQLH